MWKILNLEYCFVIGNSIELQKLILEKNIGLIMGDNVKFGKLVIIIFIYMVQISSHIYMYIYTNVKRISFHIFCSQFRVDGLMDDHHFSYVTKLKNKNIEKYHVKKEHTILFYFKLRNNFFNQCFFWGWNFDLIFFSDLYKGLSIEKIAQIHQI